jgi:dTMP kinase
MNQGTYIVFEGHDYVGKSTLTNEVNERLQKAGIKSLPTHHPGATPLGRHLRKLVKHPETIIEEWETDSIVIDSISAQTLMMVDQICFVNTVLTPELDKGTTVLADRSNFISCIAYGIAEGLDVPTINRLLQLTKSPTPDKVYVLQIPWNVAQARGKEKEKNRIKDRFEDAGNSFMRRVADIYDNLTTMNPDLLVLLTDFVPLERICYIDATIPVEELADKVLQDIIEIIDQKRMDDVDE